MPLAFALILIAAIVLGIRFWLMSGEAASAPEDDHNFGSLPGEELP